MKEKVWEYIKTHNMIEEGDRVVVGVSGGADSICLLNLLYQLSKKINIELSVAHINHGLRGKEADIDEKFVEEICKQYNINYKSYSYNINKIAKNRGISEEEAGRKVRYKSFYKSTELFNANKIAVAHNKNDNAETILFHLIRGSGIKGLTGISSKREMKSTNIEVIRPLLCISRAEIEEYLSDNNITYKIDSTNLTENYTRNKIRNKVIAYITKEINVNAIENIVKAGEHLSEISKYLEQNIDSEYYNLVKEDNNEYTLLLENAISADLVIQKGVIRRILGNMKEGLKDIESKHIDQIISLYDKSVGRLINLPGDRIAKRGYKEITFYIGDQKANKIVENKKGEEDNIHITINRIPFSYELNNINKIMDVKIINTTVLEDIPKKSCTKWFDYDKIENTIKIRTIEENDFIQIYKDGGRKNLKDLFVDIKIPKEERQFILLVADGNHIMWIIDDRAKHRISEQYKISYNTKNILEMDLANSMED
ncbi:MAG TPA: tRNA lysidine(34) synthetase TilS [Clostridiales bacterium]|nr:tRNA lysidine(34) synthetase TilS [Clostridiales bacterium]